MKKIIFIIGITLVFPALTSCNNNPSTHHEEENIMEATADSLAIALQSIDSIMNSGKLSHLDIYEIGKLKSVSVSVQKLSSGDESLAWINFRKDCGGEYYYSWEDAHLLDEECPYFLDAVNVILSNKTREVDHEERYAYITKDDIRMFSSATKGKPWNMEFSVDCHKQNSFISLSDKDVEDLKALILTAQQKIKEIK